MVKTVRVGIIGGGMISHRHMQIYKNINERAEELASVQRSLQLRLFRKDWLSGERNTVWKKKTSM